MFCKHLNTSIGGIFRVALCNSMQQPVWVKKNYFYEPFGSSRLEIMVKILKAYSEGSVGWTVDQVMVRLPNGAKLPMRHARVFHREDGAWKCVLNNISIVVPNESVGA